MRWFRCRVLAAALALAATTLVPTTAPATTVVARSLDELARGSDAVVVGVPRGARSSWSAGRITTDTDLDVLTVARGTLGPGARAVVRTPGGQVGDVVQVLVGAPVLAPGRMYVLFLGPAAVDGHREVQGLAGGVLPVTLDADGTPRVFPPRTEGLTYLPGRLQGQLQGQLQGRPSGSPPAVTLAPQGEALDAFLARLRALGQ